MLEMRALKGLARDGVVAGHGGMGCGGPREAGSSTAHPFHVVGRGSSGTRDKDLYGPVIRTLNGHVGDGGHDRDE